MTAAASLSIPLPTRRADQPFRDGRAARASGCLGRAWCPPARQRSPTPICADWSSRHSTRCPRGRPPKRSAPATNRRAEGRGTNPRIRAGPPRARAPTEAGTHRCRAPSGRGWQAITDLAPPADAGSEERHPPRTQRGSPRCRVCHGHTRRCTICLDVPRRASDPALRRKPVVASRCPSDVTPSRARNTHRRARLLPCDRHRSWTRGKPRGHTVTARGIASDPAR
jgi:hypothetical protein